MLRNRIHLILIATLILAFLAGNLVYPKYFDLGIDFLNSKLNLKLPHFLNFPFRLGLDLQGGSHLVYEADLSQVEPEGYEEAMAGLRDVIERRVDLFGVREPIVQTQQAGNNYRLIVELAGIEDVSQAIKMIGQTPYLEFKEPRTEAESQRIIDKQKEIEGKTPEELENIPDWQLAFEDPYFKPTLLTGKYLKKAELGFDQTTNKPIVLLQFNDEGAKIFEDLTIKNIGKPLAIYIDQAPISVPVVQEKITGGRAQITGKFTIEEAKALARNLNAGALPVPIKLISQQTVGPTLGKISLQMSLKAGAIGAIAVILFMILFYRLPGAIASLALGIYLVLVLSLFKLIPVTLTLAGIGGFILSIGMAVDANILIFSRMREELKEGKDFILSIEEGVRRAWPSIRDSNFTTILVSLILFFFGTSFVKGFAFTLMLGVIVSMFSAIIITNHFLKFIVSTRLGKIKWLWK
jgi:protein-export membrane protein SecD